MKMGDLTRRRFISKSTVGALSTLFISKGVVGITCDLTSPDILGPFYLSGSPSKTQIAATGEPGERLFISGKVLGNDCQTPLPGAVIEVWQADDDGCYHHPSSCGQENFKLYGQMVSNTSGNYEFETILPGKYLNGSDFRPSHIHFKITGPDQKALITQLYFEGDTSIPNDPWAANPKAKSRIVPLSTDTQGKTGVFDILLADSVGVEKGILHSTPFDGEDFALKIYTGNKGVLFSLPAKKLRLSLEIFSLRGRLIKRWFFPGKTVSWNRGHMPSGIYIVRLNMSTVPLVKTFALL